MTIFAYLLFLVMLSPSYAGMNNYCVMPPFPGTPTQPNVLLLMDYSNSMQFPVYVDCNRASPANFGDTWVDNDGHDANNCDKWASDQNGSSGHGQSNKRYIPTNDYFGYFDGNTCYSATSNRFEPSACSCANGIGSGNCISGNLLNWITTTRIDVARKVLVGGKSSIEGGATFLDSTGAYYIFFDGTLGCHFDVVTNGPDSRRLTIKSKVCSNNHTKTCTQDSDCDSGDQCVNVGSGCPFGDGTNFSSVTIKTKVANPSTIKGVVDDIWDKIHMEFMSFGSTDGSIDSDYGTMLAGKDATKSTLVEKIRTTPPNGSTPTGKALWEAYDYFKQDNEHTYEENTSDINRKNGNKDPYYDGTGDPVPCRKGFVLLLSDGAWEQEVDPVIPAKALTALQRTDFTNITPVLTYPVFAWGDLDSETPHGQGRRSMISIAIFGGFEDDNGNKWPYPFTSFSTAGTGNCNGQGDAQSDITDKFGRTYCNSRDIPAPKPGAPLLSSSSPNFPLDHCNPLGTWDPQCSEWDFDKTGLPYNFFEASDGNSLRTALLNAVYDMLRRVSSGTAISVLASGGGSGANLVQGTFYPKRRFQNTIISWTGSLKNLWYFVDPFFNNSTMREDSTNDSILDLSNDNIIKFRFDNMLQNTVADICSDPTCSTTTQTKPFESIINLWDSGTLLWQKDPATRKIFTTLGGTSLIDFSTGLNNTTLNSYLQAPDQTVADRTISYVRGADYNSKHCSISTATSCTYDADCPYGETCNNDTYCSDSNTTRCVVNADCPSGQTCTFQYRNRTVSIDMNKNGIIDAGETNVWKLGDVLNSTPKIASWIPLNTYHRVYNDTTYGPAGQDPLLEDSADPSHFLTTSDYKGRGIVFSGANDGMLHAFKFGTFELKWSGQGDTQKAKLINPDTRDICRSTDTNRCGKEMWAFIPKNVLPYLRYLADANYCHVFSVDLPSFIFDASIGATGSGDISNNTKDASAWRTILIGGMRFGGACRKTGDSCTDCVKTPLLDPLDVSKGLGYSSYFALDITNYLANQTDPINHPPQLLWEFSDDALGFTTSGPAIVRIGDKTKNGNWYVVFGSGPTGPISTTDQQFMGRSDQSMKLFVLNLKDGNRAVNPYIDTGISNAFAGSMLNVTNDTDLNYQDNAVYIPYVTKDNIAGTWTKGGIIRLVTQESTPSSWIQSKVIENIGPVTSAPARLEAKNKDKIWLFFGTGRYFFKTQTSVDDVSGQQTLYGIKDPCFSSSGFSSTCPSPLSGIGSLTPATVSPPSTEPATGWFINLDGSGNATYPEGNPVKQVTRNYGAERVITDTLATTSGVLYFTTYKPYTGVCNLGGKTFLWAMRYNTGGSAGALLKGKALIQVSTGSIEQLNLADAFKQNPTSNPDSKGDRRSGAMEGVPPTSQGLSILSSPPPVKRVLHIRER